jgi:hypothetical protein
MTSEARFVCYVHRRRDTGAPFYVGIGTPERPHERATRSPFWKRVAAKAGFEVDVVAARVTWEQACAWERAAIELVGRRDLDAGSLVNLTDGGEGAPGRPVTEEQRAAHARRARARNARPEVRAVQAERARAQWASPEARAAQAERTRARWASPEARAAMTERLRAAYASPEVRAAQAERTRAQFASPEARAAHRFGVRAYFARPEGQAAHAERVRSWLARPEVRAEHAERARARFSKPVRCLDTGEVFPSASEAARAARERGHRAHGGAVARVCRGRSKTAGGLRWEFVS